LGDSGFGKFVSFVGAVISFIPGYQWVGLIIAVGGGVYTQKALKREAMEKMRSAMEGMRANTRTTERAIPVIYGRQRVGGNVLWMSSEGKGPNDFNPPRNKLFAVYGISEGPIDDFEEMYFNDVKVWDARSGTLRTQFYNKFYHEFRTGTNSQAPFSHVATYHNLYDIASETFPLTAVSLVEFFYDSGVYQAIPTVTWTIRGKLVPDWSDANSPGVLAWNQSGPLQSADMLTNPQYGMGISSANLNVADVKSAHAYATAPISPGSREIIEIVDTSTQRPKNFVRAFDIPALTDVFQPDAPFDWFTTSPAFQVSMAGNVPIKPGSLTLTSMLGSAYYDSPRSGMISQFGRILGAAAAQVGSINYLTGDLWFTKPEPYIYMSGDNWDSIYVHQMAARWYADWEFSQRTKYQSIARSLYIVSTPETLVESSYAAPVATLYSTHGGGGTANYATGEINAYFGAHEWYDNNPIEIHYRVSTRARFSTNYPLWDSTKVIDAIKDIQQHYRGFLVYANGKYGIKVDKPEGSVYSFDDDNIVAGTFKITQPSVRDIPTKVLVKYIDAINNYTPADASFDVRSVDPGMESEHVLEMPGITFRDEANAIAYSYANLANLTNAISFQTNYNALGLEAGDVVDVTHPSAGWVQKLFRILSIEFAREDKLSLAAVEHDPAAYVDDWLQGMMVSRNPSFFPGRSYWPPNVSSATLEEYSRTLSDGTVIPTIKYSIWAVDSPNIHVSKWNIYAINVSRGQMRQLAYSGVNTIGYISPAEPGIYGISIYGVSDFGNESARAWVASLATIGTPEYEYQNWRFEYLDSNISIIDGIRNSEIIDINGKRYMANQFSVPNNITIFQMLNNQRFNANTIAISVGGAAYNISLAKNGSDISVFWTQLAGGLYNLYAASFSANSLTSTISPSLISSSFAFASIATNSGGRMFATGIYSATGERSHFGWVPVSSNLFVPTAVNCIHRISSLVSDTGYNHSLFFTQSMGVIIYGGHNYSTNSRVNGYLWTTDNSLGIYYIAGSLFYTSSATSDIGGLSVVGMKANGYYPERCWLMYDRMVDPYSGETKGNKYLYPFDARSPNPNIKQYYLNADDYYSQVGWWQGNEFGRPVVNKDTIITCWPRPLGYSAYSTTSDIDIYRYYNISSITPDRYQTYL